MFLLSGQQLGPEYQTSVKYCVSKSQCDQRNHEICWWSYNGCARGQCMCDPKTHFKDKNGKCRKRKCKRKIDIWSIIIQQESTQWYKRFSNFCYNMTCDSFAIWKPRLLIKTIYLNVLKSGYFITHFGLQKRNWKYVSGWLISNVILCFLVTNRHVGRIHTHWSEIAVFSVKPVESKSFNKDFLWKLASWNEKYTDQ